MDSLAHAIAHLIDITEAVAGGDPVAADRLNALTASDNLPPVITRLAEAINHLVVQKDVREFRLEAMIEDLLHAQAEVIKAHHDSLTELPNRAMFHELLARACADADRTGRSVALLFIDLDHFKAVNDTLGHDAGDALLVQAAARLKACVRAEDTVARLGGDEFTAILTGLEDRDIPLQVAARIVERISMPFALDAGPARIGVSVGVSFYPADADRPISLLKNADVAMYHAKESGRNTFRVYTP